MTPRPHARVSSSDKAKAVITRRAEVTVPGFVAAHVSLDEAHHPAAENGRGDTFVGEELEEIGGDRPPIDEPNDRRRRFHAPPLSEWLLRPELLEPPVAMVHNLLWAGRSTMLAGLPKAGKSTLGGQIAAALTNGARLFGQELNPVSVLWLALDEHVGDTVRRLHRFGADPARLFITDDRPPHPDALCECITAIGARVVVADTITRWWLGKVHHSNDAEEVRGFLAPYLSALRKLDVALLAAHHTTKGGVRASGSVALEAEVDAPLVLVHPAQRRMLQAGGVANDDPTETVADDGRRILQGTSRFSPHIRMSLRFDGNRFEVDPSSASRKDKMLRAGAQLTGPFTKSELATATGGNRQAALSLVDELRAAGLLTMSRGRYATSDEGREYLESATGGDPDPDVDEPI